MKDSNIKPGQAGNIYLNIL